MTDTEHPTRAMSIRGIPTNLYDELRALAAENGRSMEAEALAILEEHVHDDSSDEPGMLRDGIRARFVDLGGLADLEITPRSSAMSREVEID